MSIFDQAPPLAPIDRVARRVSRKGEHWEPRFTRNLGAAQLPQIAPLQAEPLPASERDCAGLRRGRMVAYQYLGKNPKGRVIWNMRCDCGLFETRQIKKWVAAEGGVDCCQRCDEAHHVKTGRYLAQLRPAKGSLK